MTDAVVQLAQSILAKPSAVEPRLDPDLTDTGNAERLVRNIGSEIRYVPGLGWFVWDGKRWREDHLAMVVEHAKLTARAIFSEAVRAESEGKQKEVAKWALKSQDRNRIEAMLALARSEPGVGIMPDELDPDPWLFNCQNVTVDLRTGKMKQHDPANLITKIAPVVYDPTATYPKWEAFLTKIFPGKPYLPFFLKQAVGYSLTGNTREQCIFIPYGTGQNGKSTFIDTISRIMGEYAGNVPVEAMLISKRDGDSAAIAKLRGDRFVTASEAEAGKRLAESLVKQMTGGEKMTAKLLYKNYFDFYPQFKLWLSTNNKPVIRGTDEGIWRRIRLIPFDYRIPDQEKIPDFHKTFEDELPGILAWAVAGCAEWFENGLIVPDEVKVATKSYRADMDILGNFLDECCTVADGLQIRSSILYQEYVVWCDKNGEYKASNKAFSGALTARDFGRRHTRDGSVWHGISVVNLEKTETYIQNNGVTGDGS